MANEVLVERKVYRIMANITNKLWHKIAWWTTANSVDAEDGRSLETKVGAINGITDSLTSTSSNIAASAKAVNTLNSNLNVVPNFNMLTTNINVTAGQIVSYTSDLGKTFNSVNDYYVDVKVLTGSPQMFKVGITKELSRYTVYVYSDWTGIANVNTIIISSK